MFLEVICIALCWNIIKDEDVFAERHRVNNMTNEDINKESVVIKDLTKVGL